MIKSLLIANRGEIAVRIIKTCKKMGIRTVQVFSDADKDSLATKLADEAVNIGPPPAAQSYLCGDIIIEKALERSVDAIHPGYGFLSENALFSANVTKKGLIFIGPSSEVIKSLGDKIAARRIAETAGIEAVPGCEIDDLDSVELNEIVAKIGFPLMIKAAAGGGGRGIRVVDSISDLESSLATASAEAKASFGDGTIYLERYIKNARHIEVQFLGDGHTFLHLFERECSIQRRRQKIWEEAPASCLTSMERKRVCEMAIKLASHVNYRGVGTVEFLYDIDRKTFYFIEVNTRIQVEHPTTEFITGLDIVELMIKVAAGTKLELKQNAIKYDGHAIECRINAEDPDNGFFPSPGIVEKISLSKSENIRFDTFLTNGAEVPAFYDSMIGKLIAFGENREASLKNLSEALDNLHISGIATTIPLHKKLAKNIDVINNDVNINFLEKKFLD